MRPRLTPTDCRDVSERATTSAPTAALAVEPGRAVRKIRSAELFADGPRVVIEHRGVEYRLQITRMGKLILTK
jgi:hemin uptake protein HemP